MVIDIPFFTQDVIPALNQGLKVSIALIVPASILGFVGGVALGCLRAFGGPWSSRLGNWYTAIIRGVPLAVQLMMIYYALPKMGIYFEPYGAALLSFILCSAAYHSEYIRGALLSIRQGQIKAAQAHLPDRVLDRHPPGRPPCPARLRQRDHLPYQVQFPCHARDL